MGGVHKPEEKATEPKTKMVWKRWQKRGAAHTLRIGERSSATVASYIAMASHELLPTPSSLHLVPYDDEYLQKLEGFLEL